MEGPKPGVALATLAIGSALILLAWIAPVLIVPSWVVTGTGLAFLAGSPQHRAHAIGGLAALVILVLLCLVGTGISFGIRGEPIGQLQPSGPEFLVSLGAFAGPLGVSAALSTHGPRMSRTLARTGIGIGAFALVVMTLNFVDDNLVGLFAIPIFVLPPVALAAAILAWWDARAPRRVDDAVSA